MEQPVPEIASEEPVNLGAEEPAEGPAEACAEAPAEAAQNAAKPKRKPKRKPKAKPKLQTQKQRRRRRRQPQCSRHGLSHRRSYESFAIYFPRVLNSVQEGLSLSHQALSVLDSFVEDIFERIVREAAQLTHASNRVTITSQEIQSAVRMLLPGELAKHAEMEGTRALIRYTSSPR